MNTFHVTSEFYNGLNNYSHEMHSWHNVLTNLHYFSVNDMIQIITPVTTLISIIALQIILTFSIYYTLSYFMYEQYTLTKKSTLNDYTLKLSRYTHTALSIYLITLIIFVVAQILVILTQPVIPTIKLS